jgi:hypothetical protein
MSAVAAQSLEKPAAGPVEMLAASVRLVNGTEGAVAEAPVAASTPAANATVDSTSAAATVSANAEATTSAAGEPQPPIEATAARVTLPQPSTSAFSGAFTATGPMSDAYAAISSGLFTLGGLAVRMARSLRTGSARW